MWPLGKKKGKKTAAGNPACTRPGSRPGRPENRRIDRMNRASALGSRPAASLGPAREAAGSGTQQSEPAKAWPRPSQREKEPTGHPRLPAWSRSEAGPAGLPGPFFSLFLNFCPIKKVPRKKCNNFRIRTPFSIILDSLESSQRAQKKYVQKNHSPRIYYKNK